MGASRTDISQDIHQFKLGMNYKLGGAQSGPWTTQRSVHVASQSHHAHGRRALCVRMGPVPQRPRHSVPRRLVACLAADLRQLDRTTALRPLPASIPRSGSWSKGLIGGASSAAGRLNDEDWDLDFPGADVAYSNTLSDVDNDIHYGIVDVGYAVWRGANYSVAPFVGYSQFEQRHGRSRLPANRQSVFRLRQAHSDKHARHHRGRQVARSTARCSGGRGACAAAEPRRRCRLFALREIQGH